MPTFRRNVRHVALNFGPQHPAAHGILRLALQLEGEVVSRVDPEFGLLHRGSEKLMEARTSAQALPYVDRFDYVANLFQEHAFALSVESSSDLKPGLRTVIFRTVTDEMSRCLNHLLTLSAVCMDLGAMGPMFWAFEERENLMELFERLSGARMHTALHRPGEETPDLATSAWLSDAAYAGTRAARSVSGAFLGLTANRAIKTRSSGVGSFSSSKVLAYGVTGVFARASGRPHDLRFGLGRTSTSYGAYPGTSFRTFLGRRGDNWDRFLIRAKELLEAFRLVSQLANNLAPAAAAAGRASSAHARPSIPTSPASSPWSPHTKFSSMEGVISHFKLSSSGSFHKPSLAYAPVESPKGDLGFLTQTTSSPRISRLSTRSPVAHNMHIAPSGAGGSTFADFVATFCSLDVVLGEIDR